MQDSRDEAHAVAAMLISDVMIQPGSSRARIFSEALALSKSLASATPGCMHSPASLAQVLGHGV